MAWLFVNEADKGEEEEGGPPPIARPVGLHVGPASVCNLIVGKCGLLESKWLSSMNSRPAEGQGCCVGGFWISAVSRCD